LLELAQHLRATAEAAQRRLLRYSFDLHDGVLQDVVALLMDLRLFRSALKSDSPASPELDVLERVSTFEGRLAEIERELREVAQSLGAVTVPDVGDAVRAAGEALAAGAGIEVDVEVSGATDGLTESQQIALLRIVQGALANIRQHSGATAATGSLVVSERGAELCIRDNGRGFDVDGVFARTGAGGSLGLFAMRERVRLLGGEFRVTSEPGLTEVLVRLPRWPGPAQGTQTEA
jgi:signal transduction histidine kinase